MSELNLKKPKFKDGDKVTYNGLTYEIIEVGSFGSGNWYTLKDRLGYVNERELKKAVKR